MWEGRAGCCFAESRSACSILDLWAVKEASYKALQKESLDVRFIPNEFICENTFGGWRCNYKNLFCEVQVYQPLVEISHLIGADRDADFEHLSEGNIQLTISEDKCSKDAREMRQGNGKFQLEAGIKVSNDFVHAIAMAGQQISSEKVFSRTMALPSGMTPIACCAAIGFGVIGGEWLCGLLHYPAASKWQADAPADMVWRPSFGSLRR